MSLSPKNCSILCNLASKQSTAKRYPASEPNRVKRAPCVHHDEAIFVELYQCPVRTDACSHCTRECEWQILAAVETSFCLLVLVVQDVVSAGNVKMNRTDHHDRGLLVFLGSWHPKDSANPVECQGTCIFKASATTELSGMKFARGTFLSFLADRKSRTRHCSWQQKGTATEKILDFFFHTDDDAGVSTCLPCLDRTLLSNTTRASHHLTAYS